VDSAKPRLDPGKVKQAAEASSGKPHRQSGEWANNSSTHDADNTYPVMPSGMAFLNADVNDRDGSPPKKEDEAKRKIVRRMSHRIANIVDSVDKSGLNPDHKTVIVSGIETLTPESKLTSF